MEMVRIVRRDPTVGRIYTRNAAEVGVQLRRLQLALQIRGVRLGLGAILPLAVLAVDEKQLFKLATDKAAAASRPVTRTNRATKTAPTSSLNGVT